MDHHLGAHRPFARPEGRDVGATRNEGFGNRAVDGVRQQVMLVQFRISPRRGLPRQKVAGESPYLAMPRMLKELQAHPELGMLSGELWGGRTTILVQYWRSSDHLFAYARNRDARHLPAWRAFNQAVGTNGDVGVWHETYVVSPGTYENIYVNMPPFGLGKVGTLSAASAGLQSADARLKASETQP